MLDAVVYQHGYRLQTSGPGVLELVGSLDILSIWLIVVIVNVDMDFDEKNPYPSAPCTTTEYVPEDLYLLRPLDVSIETVTLKGDTS